MTALPSLVPNSSDVDILVHLRDCRRILTDVNNTRVVLMTDKILGFRTDKERAQEVYPHDVERMREMQARELFDNWRKVPFGDADVKIALAATYTASWVRLSQAERERQEQHAWVAVVVRRRDHQGRVKPGKTLLIWDANFEIRWRQLKEDAAAQDPPRPPARRLRSPLVLNRQRDWVADLRKHGKTAVHDIWVGGWGNHQDSDREGQCLPLAINWLREFCQGQLVLSSFSHTELKKARFRQLTW